MGQRILRISGRMFPQLFSGEQHYRVVRDPIPEGVRVRNVTLEFPYSANHDTIAILLESDQWDGPSEGQVIPEITPLCEVIGAYD